MNNFLPLTKDQDLVLNEISYYIKGIDFNTLIFNLDLNYNLRNVKHIHYILDYLTENNLVISEIKNDFNYFIEILKVKNDNTIR
jgi:hypothetical protein